MPVKKLSEKKIIKKVVVKKTTVKAETVNLSVPMFELDGNKNGTLALPKEIFGAKVNKKLLSQAYRIYLNNANAHHSNTKTRGEVQGSTRKIRAQKGTGGARHGGVRAPIFVGGGIAHGPKYRKIILDLPKKMKKAALVSALSEKVRDSEIMGITGLDKITGKTKEIRSLVEKLQYKNLLIVAGDKNEALKRAVGNLSTVSFVLAEHLNIMDLIKYQKVMVTSEAVKVLESRIKNNKEEESVK